MKLSDAEKLFLIMLNEIYEKVGIEAAINPEFGKMAISVVDILEMWSMIEGAYGKLSDPEKETLEHEAASVHFEGFDFNNDDEYGVAHFLINDLKSERFSSFKGRALNSHSSSVLKQYRRMLAVFRPIRIKLKGRSLNVPELTEILKAQKCPK